MKSHWVSSLHRNHEILKIPKRATNNVPTRCSNSCLLLKNRFDFCQECFHGTFSFCLGALDEKISYFGLLLNILIVRNFRKMLIVFMYLDILIKFLRNYRPNFGHHALKQNLYNREEDSIKKSFM